YTICAAKWQALFVEFEKFISYLIEISLFCYKSDTKKSRSPIKNQQNRTVALLLHSMQPCYNRKYTLKRQSALRFGALCAKRC
ncbi:hypothetical protein, partial [Gemmiger sp.]|uniref:hypothetical protein n=1 Tax=Gemmiger sp. TaxID=2049027 RepID=UPI003A8D5475